MKSVTVNFQETCGKIKPMHAVNNGPAGSRVRQTGNFKAYAEARIPYARLHDASFYSGYGGEWSVDVHRIFTDFSKDVDDETAYDFTETDTYLQDILSVGTKIFYRLGASIEHRKKYGTYPPKDYLKWAKICEHIIRHYNEGWANGFHMDIEYWEIWNEPDCQNADGSNPCWQGTQEEFLTFYETAAKYLKGQFPALKIGGPAICWLGSGLAEKFLKYCKKQDVPLDFFSFHCYTKEMETLLDRIQLGKKWLVEYGYPNTELILNEWNYIRGWLNEDWKYSLRMEKGLKGSSFVTGAMCVGQNSPLDMLMYYDARPCGMNGMFDTDTLAPLKTYYVIKAFSTLYELGNAVKTSSEKDVYVCGAVNGDEAAVLCTFYNDADDAPAEIIRLTVDGFAHSAGVMAKVYQVSEENDLTLVKEELFTGDSYAILLKAELFTTYLIKLEKSK